MHQSDNKFEQSGHCSMSPADEDPELPREDLDRDRALNRFENTIDAVGLEAGVSMSFRAFQSLWRRRRRRRCPNSKEGVSTSTCCTFTILHRIVQHIFLDVFLHCQFTMASIAAMALTTMQIDWARHAAVHLARG